MTWSDVRKKIEDNAKLPPDWDGSGANAPTDKQTDHAIKTVRCLEVLGFPVPTWVTLASDGHAVIGWANGLIHADMELIPDGNGTEFFCSEG